ncbi:hypothetical protein [Clostridium lundense]|nr:hypothetical protein [Clostridium lundense]
MIKIKAVYSTENEKERLLQELKTSFEVLKVSKEYKNEGQYRRIHIDLR